MHRWFYAQEPTRAHTVGGWESRCIKELNCPARAVTPITKLTRNQEETVRYIICTSGAYSPFSLCFSSVSCLLFKKSSPSPPPTTPPSTPLPPAQRVRVRSSSCVAFSSCLINSLPFIRSCPSRRSNHQAVSPPPPPFILFTCYSLMVTREIHNCRWGFLYISEKEQP